MTKKDKFAGTKGVPRELELSYGEKVKLDDKDKQILHMLSQDGRATIIEIAREIGMSRDAAKYRLDRLLKNHVIQGFVPVVNPPKIGLPLYVGVMISLWNISPERENKLIAFVRQASQIVYAAKAMGKCDLYLEYFARDPGQLDEMLAKLREQFSDIIKDIEVLTYIKEYKWAEFAGFA